MTPLSAGEDVLQHTSGAEQMFPEWCTVMLTMLDVLDVGCVLLNVYVNSCQKYILNIKYELLYLLH